jgi:hypothetical protein
MAPNRERSNRYDPWYAVAFVLFLCVLVGSPVALYSPFRWSNLLRAGFELGVRGAAKAFRQHDRRSYSSFS